MNERQRIQLLEALDEVLFDLAYVDNAFDHESVEGEEIHKKIVTAHNATIKVKRLVKKYPG